MFKVPDWEDDTLKVNLSFPKKAKINKNELKKLLEVPKSETLIKSKLKAKNNLNENIKLPNEKQKSVKNNNIGVEINKKDYTFYDTDKLDELILNEKKQKLNSYKKEDIEELLFNDNENTKLVNNESANENKEPKKLNQLQNRKKNVKTSVDKKTGALKSTQKRNINNSENDKTNEIDNEMLKTNEKRKNKIKKPMIQNGNQNDLENKETQALYQSKNEIVKRKDEKKMNIQKSTFQNSNKNNSENKISKEINSLSGRNKIIKIKEEKKKEALRTILHSESYRNSINVSGNKLRERMLERLKAAQFRYLNEKLYTSSGSDAKQLFQEDPQAFQTYHEGYQQQVKRWPVKPLDVIVKRIQKMPKTHTIADMGCGEAELSNRVVQSVRSFDLVASKPEVETCDMAHTPLLSSSMDVAVYCLALMGTDLTQYLIEANRVLKIGGHLLIAEVESRFHDVDSFTRDVQKLGFTLKKIDKSQTVFFFMEFTKVRDPPVKKAKLPLLSLKPCIYKKR